jgi:hypothetical protein
MNLYYEQGKELLYQLNSWYALTKQHKNEQWHIAILDELNKLSVDDPTIKPNKKQNKNKDDNIPYIVTIDTE